MADSSPKSKRGSLNKSTVLKRGVTLQTDTLSESDENSPEDRKHIKLPEIILSKLHTTKANEAFKNIPGLKSTKNKTTKANHKRAMTEKKEGKRDYSVDSKTK